MKTILAAAIASLMLSSATFAAAPAVTREAPKASSQQKGNTVLARGYVKPAGTGANGGGIFGKTCLMCR